MRNLKIQYNRESTKLKKKMKSRAGASDVQVTWPYYLQLEFLKDPVAPRATRDNLGQVSF